jgi:hypothetical protein
MSGSEVAVLGDERMIFVTGSCGCSVGIVIISFFQSLHLSWRW